METQLIQVQRRMGTSLVHSLYESGMLKWVRIIRAACLQVSKINGAVAVGVFVVRAFNFSGALVTWLPSGWAMPHAY